MLSALILAAATAAAPAPADPPAAPLKPLGKWIADWGDASCHIVQRYGDAAAPITLAIRPSINGDVIRLMLSEKGYRATADHFPVKVGDVATTALGFTPRKSKIEVTWINLDRAAFDRLAAAPMLQLRARWIKLDLSTQGLAAAVRAMDRCNADLRAVWNADAAGEARIATPAQPRTSIADMFSSEDYPTQAINEGKGGTTAMSVLVDEQGVVKDCVIEVHSGVATLDAQTCLVVKERGRFTPARDAQGKAIKSRLFYRFRWLTA